MRLWLDRPRARTGRVAPELGEHLVDGVRQRLRLGRLVPLPGVRMRNPDPCLVADELDGAAARRVHDRQPAGHRLDDERRARILHLRVQEDVRAAEDTGGVALRVLAEQVHATAQAELLDERLDGHDEAAGDEEACVGLPRE